MARRTVITGIGVVAPGGDYTKGFWELLTAGRTATRRISAFDPGAFRSQVAAECDFDPALRGLRHREIRRMDRATQFAIACTRESLQDSGLDLDGVDRGRLAVSIGTAVGAATSLEQEYLVLSDTGRDWVVDHRYASPHLFNHFTPTTIATEVAWEVGAEGPVGVVSTGCTSGMDSVGHAYQLISEGRVDVAVTGATEAAISPLAVACFDALKATTPRNDDPEHAARPFDRTRNGFVIAEGAAMFVLEEYEHARRRGAHIYAEIAGFANRCNAYHMTALHPDGREMAEAMSAAMREAGVGPQDVDYINAHGSGTKQNDRHETGAFKRVLGQHAYEVPVSSIKSMIGHSLGAIGSIEIAACALAIEHSVVPPTANLHEKDPECDLDYVPLTARDHVVDTAVTVGSGFGGFQSAMVLRKWRGVNA
ncbi:beta-ketoacyl-[acyl-carrier-protein] synthase family protein [Micromonospora sp. NPDC002296]|uniref:beta-ketoacyl-[acyl-carrier-protein] synthase family protein n=1 Tax=Micromonospora sp. NPDC002296 TaxID=3154271 RepID=UPI003326FDC9